MWSQAATNHMVLRPLTSHGWKISEDKLVFDWAVGKTWTECIKEYVDYCWGANVREVATQTVVDAKDEVYFALKAVNADIVTTWEHLL